MESFFFTKNFLLLRFEHSGHQKIVQLVQHILRRFDLGKTCRRFEDEAWIECEPFLRSAHKNTPSHF